MHAQHARSQKLRGAQQEITSRWQQCKLKRHKLTYTTFDVVAFPGRACSGTRLILFFEGLFKSVWMFLLFI